MKDYYEHVSGPNFRPAPKYDVIDFDPAAVSVESGIIVEERQATAAELLLFRGLARPVRA